MVWCWIALAQQIPEGLCFEGLGHMQCVSNTTQGQRTAAAPSKGIDRAGVVGLRALQGWALELRMQQQAQAPRTLSESAEAYMQVQWQMPLHAACQGLL